MPSVILDNSRSGDPIVFFGSGSWKRDARGTWLARTADRQPVTYKKLSHLMDHIVRQPERVQTIDDAPELSADDTAATEWINARIAKLDAVIVKARVRRLEDRILMGRALLEQKKILGHGRFKSHVSDALGSFFSFRTAERYMTFAREADAASKSDNLSLLNSASDEAARHIRSATKQAQRSAPYKLPLRLNSHDRRAVDALRKTSDWAEAEQSIVEEVRRQCIKYGVYNEKDQEERREDNSADA